MIEPILVPNEQRFVLFPIKYQSIFDFYKQHEAAIWRTAEIDLSTDLHDWNNVLNDNERFFIKNILSFFASSDGIVNENLALNFYNEVQYPEARAFYAIQIFMECVHSEQYSLMIDTYIKDEEERNKCFDAIHNMPAVALKANWALNWIKSESFVERLIAFIAVEGIFFSGSFCAIFFLKNRNLMPGLCHANTLINRDENCHCNYAIELLNNYIINKPSEKKIKEILLSALEIEKKFITESLPVSLIGMNAGMMKQYLEFVTDSLLIKLNCKKEFNVEQPFKWMEQIAIELKGNFFESRVSEYQKANLSGEIKIDEDF